VLQQQTSGDDDVTRRRHNSHLDDVIISSSASVPTYATLGRRALPARSRSSLSAQRSLPRTRRAGPADRTSRLIIVFLLYNRHKLISHITGLARLSAHASGFPVYGLMTWKCAKNKIGVNVSFDKNFSVRYFENNARIKLKRILDVKNLNKTTRISRKHDIRNEDSPDETSVRI